MSQVLMFNFNRFKGQIIQTEIKYTKPFKAKEMFGF